MSAIKKVRSEGIEIDVITSQPNRYAEIASDVEAFEDYGWLRVWRVSLPSHKGGMLDQALAYKNYFGAVQARAQEIQWDGVFATSSRLMTAATGALIARKQRIPLYLDIRDLFVDTLVDILNKPHHKPLLSVLRQLERYTMRTADSINVVSPGFRTYIQSLDAHVKITEFTNGIDDEFLQEDFDIAPPAMEGQRPLRILYAGNIGQGQGLHSVIPQSALRLRGKASFRIIGDGGLREQLRKEIESLGLDESSVELLPPIERSDLIKEYKAADILLLHLNDLDAFHKVLPSKLFEYAATQKPVLAGVDGEAANFLKTHLPDIGVFKPCDIDGLIAKFEQVSAMSEPIDRSQFYHRFARSRIMQDMATDVLTFFEKKGESNITSHAS